MVNVMRHAIGELEARDRERKYLNRLDHELMKDPDSEETAAARKALLAFYNDTGVLDPKRRQGYERHGGQGGSGPEGRMHDEVR